MNKFKAGDCVIISHDNNKLVEGVVLEYFDDTDKFRILSFCQLDNKQIFRFSEKVFYNSGEYELAPIPHFCKIENLYEILSKYGQFKLLGINYINDEHGVMACFQTSKKYIQVISYYQYYSTSYVYIHETDDVKNFYIDKRKRFAVPQRHLNLNIMKLTSNLDIQLKSEITKNNGKDSILSGVVFKNTNDEFILSFYDYEDKFSLSTYKHGYSLNDEKFYDIYDSREFLNIINSWS